MIGLALLAVAAAAQQPAKRPGLEAQLTSLGVTHERYPDLTASVKLTNNSPVYVFVLLFGAPHAVDDAGGDFGYGRNAVTGIAYCLGREGPGRPDPRSCVKPATRGEQDFLFPVDQYTEIDPGQSANFTVTLRSM